MSIMKKLLKTIKSAIANATNSNMMCCSGTVPAWVYGIK